jgi:hypothetical protein
MITTVFLMEKVQCCNCFDQAEYYSLRPKLQFTWTSSVEERLGKRLFTNHRRNFEKIPPDSGGGAQHLGEQGRKPLTRGRSAPKRGVLPKRGFFQALGVFNDSSLCKARS